MVCLNTLECKLLMGYPLAYYNLANLDIGETLFLFTILHEHIHVDTLKKTQWFPILSYFCAIHERGDCI